MWWGGTPSDALLQDGDPSPSCVAGGFDFDFCVFFFNIYSLIFGFAGSLVAVCGLLIAGASLAAQGPHSRPIACGIAPDQGSNPCPLCWQAGSSPPDHQGRPGFLF